MNIVATIACSHMPDPAQLLQAAVVAAPELATADFERYLLMARELSGGSAMASVRHRRNRVSALTLVAAQAYPTTDSGQWPGFQRPEFATAPGAAFNAHA